NEAPFAERTVVRSGSQSMPLTYDNTSFAFSEAKRTFDDAQDWTAHGVKTLAIHFAGTAGNTGKLYVKINNAKVSYNGDEKDLARTGWQAWNIDLTKITGMSNVRSLTIGVEGAGATGKLYFDDIRLSPKAPQYTTPAEPDNANLIAWYAFEGDVKDSSGKGRNGVAVGGPTYAAGVDGQALRLDGTDDYVTVGSVGISGAAPRTISGWVKADNTTFTDWTNLFGFTSKPDGVAAQSFDMNKIGGTNQYGIHAYGWERTILTIDLEWHHLAATYDGATIAWYGDGQFVASEAWVLNTQDNFQMGKRAHAAGGNFPGLIDEVRIYNKALSAEEIAWLAGRRLPIHKPL
ncbi:MAG TPA: LamG domain-containing protein, partial [Sedimentisphaerales bacterium]|nr:LamG domain-containing protein [Sedimentisphaerales bacterium]